MTEPVKLLLIEDSPDDTALLLRYLARDGLAVDLTRVESGPALDDALERGDFDVVISDYSMPGFSGRLALERVRARCRDVPFIIVSGTIGEKTAVDMMRAGATDYLLKHELARLPPVVRRELQEASERRARRHAEEALRASERDRRRETLLLQQTQAIARVGGWEFEPSSGRIFWTEECYRLFDAAPGEFEPSKSSLLPLVEPAERDRLVSIWEKASRGPEPLDLEFQARTLAGRPLWLRVIARFVAEEGLPERMVGALVDVTERKRIDAQLLLTDRLTSMGTIAAGVAHEINNPLSFVLGNIPLALGRLGEIERPVSEEPVPPGEIVREVVPLLRDCLVGAQRIATIVRDLKVYSRASDDRPTGVAIGDVLGSVLRMLENESRHRARVELVVPELPEVLAISSRLAQLFTNLVVNALQALPDRPAEENLVRVCASMGEDGFVAVEVRDNGAGIPAELRARIFEPFFTTKPEGVGTGLGLAVCQQIVAGIGGSMTLDSEVGRGTAFRVRLPVAPPKPGAASASKSAAGEKRRARVLVIDDEQILLNVVRRILRDHDVTTALGADAALTILDKDQAFDVLLCDLMMPGKSGMEFYDLLMARSPSLAARCVFVSGGAFTPKARAFVERMPAERLLEKPFAPAALLARVEGVLGGA